MILSVLKKSISEEVLDFPDLRTRTKPSSSREAELVTIACTSLAHVARATERLCQVLAVIMTQTKELTNAA